MFYDIFEFFETDNQKEQTHIMKYPLLWFLEELPYYVRLTLATSIIGFLLYRTLKTNGPFAHLRRNLNTNTKQDTCYSSDDEDY